MYDILLENSLKQPSNLINEAVTAEYYQTMIGNILKDKIRYGLFYNIAEVQPATQPAGVVFSRKNNTDGTFEIKSTPVEIKTYKSIAKITQEGLEDLLKISTYNQDDTEKYPALFEDFVKSIAGHTETSELLSQVKTAAIQADALTLTGTDAEVNGETNIFYIQKYVNELILKMNSQNFKTYDAFCILPSSGVGGILGLGATYSRISQQGTDSRSHDYLLSTINNVKYYINPNKDETSAIVGLYSSTEKGSSSLIYNPFSILTSTAVDPDSGVKTLCVFVRSGLAINPLHSAETPMLMKFEVKLNDKIF